MVEWSPGKPISKNKYNTIRRKWIPQKMKKKSPAESSLRCFVKRQKTSNMAPIHFKSKNKYAAEDCSKSQNKVESKKSVGSIAQTGTYWMNAIIYGCKNHWWWIWRSIRIIRVQHHCQMVPPDDGGRISPLMVDLDFDVLKKEWITNWDSKFWTCPLNATWIIEKSQRWASLQRPSDKTTKIFDR